VTGCDAARPGEPQLLAAPVVGHAAIERHCRRDAFLPEAASPSDTPESRMARAPGKTAAELGFSPHREPLLVASGRQRCEIGRLYGGSSRRSASGVLQAVELQPCALQPPGRPAAGLLSSGPPTFHAPPAARRAPGCLGEGLQGDQRTSWHERLAGTGALPRAASPAERSGRRPGLIKHGRGVARSSPSAQVLALAVISPPALAELQQTP